VRFESSDGSISGIAAMTVGQHQLVLLGVNSLEFWFETLGRELLMDVIIGLDPL
jgi:hypothetical protein